jgi:hypothetical protein
VSLSVNSFIKENRANNSPSGHCNPNTKFNLMRWHLNYIVGDYMPSKFCNLAVNETRKVKPRLVSKRKCNYMSLLRKVL